MAIPSYPAELPAPLAPDFQISMGDGRWRSNNDAGPGNTRGRFSSVVDQVQFSTLLDRQQLGRFQRFYHDDTKKGKLPFYIPDPSTDGWPWLDDQGNVLLFEDGTPILMTANWLVLFDQLPVIRTRDIYWTVSFSLLVLP